jgi:hypothetical protein
MRRSLLIALVALNLLLAVALAAGPARTQILPQGFRNCCKYDGPQESLGYCCPSCCWFTSNCRSDADCQDVER